MRHLAPLDQRTIGEYLDQLASSAPAPGGGSVAGLVGALAAGLGQMVVSLTAKNEPESPLTEQFATLGAARAALLAAAAADERAYSAYIESARMPKTTGEEKERRRNAMQAALTNAASVPLMLAEAACNMLEELAPVIREGTPHALSDAEMAIILAQTTVSTGLVNVRVNIPLIKDQARARSLASRAAAVESKSSRLAAELLDALAYRRD